MPMAGDADKTIEEIASRHGVQRDTVLVLREAVARGHGRMAQFNIPELGGNGQWMAGGMTMVGDMFNNGLRARVAALCEDLAARYAAAPSPSQSSMWFDTAANKAWWPDSLGKPSSTGGQNDFRYAIFPAQRRLVTDLAGAITVYDTLDYKIGGVSQQQSTTKSFTISTDRGMIALTSLPVVTGSSESTERRSSDDIVQTLHRLADLHKSGVLTDDEFAAKKAELLSRM
jgi:hypothetical protein